MFSRGPLPPEQGWAYLLHGERAVGCLQASGASWPLPPLQPEPALWHAAPEVQQMRQQQRDCLLWQLRPQPGLQGPAQLPLQLPCWEQDPGQLAPGGKAPSVSH